MPEKAVWVAPSPIPETAGWVGEVRLRKRGVTESAGYGAPEMLAADDFLGTMFPGKPWTAHGRDRMDVSWLAGTEVR